MKYDLSAMARAKSGPPRRSRRFRVRGPALRFERELTAIFTQAVEFWVERLTASELIVDADLPDPENVSSVSDEALLAILVDQVRLWVSRLAEWQRKLWIAKVLEVTGVDVTSLATSQVDAEGVVAVRQWAEALLKDVSEQTRSRVVGAVAESRALGLPQREARSKVTEVVEKARTRARVIGRDMTEKVYAQLNQAQQGEAGVTRYKWNHSFRPNPRRHHIERQGNIYEWSKPPRDGHPGHAPGCRCTAEPVI